MESVVASYRYLGGVSNPGLQKLGSNECDACGLADQICTIKRRNRP